MDLPAGIRNFTYAQDMAIFRTRWQWVMLVVFMLALFAAPMLLNNYWLGIANLIGISIIAATGLNILIGYCGQLSIGHAGFMAVGAYAYAIMVSRFEWPFLAAMVFAGIVAGLTGLLFGIPSVRVKGFYLAISTIAAHFIIIWVINQWSSLTGGYNGMGVPVADLFGISFAGQKNQFYLIFVITALVIFAAKNIARTRLGRAFVAVRDNDLAAEVMGINLFRYKLLAFFIGCFLAGIAGSLMANWIGYLNAENFTLNDSILYIGMIIIGGLGTTLGPILGVVFIRLLQEWVNSISPLVEGLIPALPAGFTAGLGPMVFGLVIVLFLVLEPRGLAHRWNLFKASYRLWPFSY